MQQAGRAGLPQYVLEFARPVGRIRGNQDHAGEADGLLEDDPVRAVRRPDGHPVAGFEARAQCPGGALCIRQELSIGPASPGCHVFDGVHQPDAIGDRCGSPPEEVAQAQVEYVVAYLGGPV